MDRVDEIQKMYDHIEVQATLIAGWAARYEYAVKLLRMGVACDKMETYNLMQWFFTSPEPTAAQPSPAIYRRVRWLIWRAANEGRLWKYDTKVRGLLKGTIEVPFVNEPLP